MAYVDRLRRRFRGPAAFKSVSPDLPLPIREEFAQRLETEGWGGLYRISSWVRDLPSGLSLLGSALWGFASDLSSAASLWVLRKAGVARSETTLSVLEAVYSGPDGKPYATVRAPNPGGGWVRHGFRLVAAPEIMLSLGEGVEFLPPTRRQRPRLRPLSPPSAVGENGSLKHLSASELVSVVSAHASQMDFAGLWERVRLPANHLGQKCLSPRLAGLFVHRRTNEAILVFRGTHPLSLTDWAVNVGTTHAIETYQHRGAITTARAAQVLYPKLLLAGHSKGGGMAQYASYATALPAVTFNSVGLPLDKLGMTGPPPATIEHFMVKYDVVSNVAGQPHTGGMGITGPIAALLGNEQRMLGGPSCVQMLPPPTSRHRLASLHSLESLRESLRENPIVIPDPCAPHRSRSFGLRSVIVSDHPTAPIIYEPAPRPRTPRLQRSSPLSPTPRRNLSLESE